MKMGMADSALAGRSPEEIGQLGSEFTAYMMEAAENYCIEKAIQSVKKGFKDGYASTDGRIDTSDGLH